MPRKEQWRVKRKRIRALLLAAVMAVSLASSAMAAGTPNVEGNAGQMGSGHTGNYFVLLFVLLFVLRFDIL
jgi:hypothetical protein